MTCPACGGALRAVAPRARQRAGVARDAAAAALRGVRDGADGGRRASPRPTRRAPTRPGAPRGARARRAAAAAFDRQRPARCSATPTGPLLDVGAGRGRFVAYARAHGFPDATRHRAVVAVVRAARRRRSRSRTPRRAGPRRDHAVARPRARRGPGRGAARGCAAGCGRAATLLVGVPDLDSLQARLGGPRWYHLDLPRHRTHFTARGIGDAARAHRLHASSTSSTGCSSTTRSACGSRPSTASRRRRHGSTTRSSATRRCAPPTPSRPRSRCRSLPLALAAEAAAGPPAAARSPSARRPSLKAWKASEASSTTPTCSGGWPRWPSRCRARRTSPGPTTRSSSRWT